MLKRFSLLVAGLGLALASAAQTNWPDRPLRLVVGSTPAGSNDLAARAISDALGKVLGQSVVVENKPGVGSSIGADFVVKSPADGYTILVGASPSLSINPALDARWASAQTLVPVAKISTSPLIIAANAQTGFKTVRDLVDYAKKNPGKLNVAHSGQGSVVHLGGVLFAQMAGIDVVQVPFKGGAPAVQSLLANDTQVTFGTPPALLPHIKSGRLTALAVTMPERFSLTPEVPGMNEAGMPNLKADIWYGLFVPAGTPAPIVRKLFEATNTILQRPEVRAALNASGMEATPLPSTEAFAAFVAEDIRMWGPLARGSGAKVE